MTRNIDVAIEVIKQANDFEAIREIRESCLGFASFLDPSVSGEEPEHGLDHPREEFDSGEIQPKRTVKEIQDGVWTKLLVALEKNGEPFRSERQLRISAGVGNGGKTFRKFLDKYPDAVVRVRKPKAEQLHDNISSNAMALKQADNDAELKRLMGEQTTDARSVGRRQRRSV